ncbi:Protein of unknown function DUF247, plant [Dillenia turbinata]|uniref:Uncharacterized protein n=1 Tax=Dillenia turbinata TaxID=194707 RepID=A0AAN8ULH6_9MAGN
MSQSVSAEIQGSQNWVVTSIREKLQNLPPLSSTCWIYRVPDKLKRTNEEAYTPRIVSIGPFHHGKEKLQAMEEHKLRYLDKFVKRMEDKASLEDCVKVIESREERIRDSFAERIDMSSENFVLMILTDSAFIIELLLLHSHYDSIDDTDPICKKPWLIDDVSRDLSLLENQLPLFILEELFNLAFGSNEDIADSFLKISYKFFVGSENINKFLEHTLNSGVQHFVDLLRIYYITQAPERRSRQQVEFPISAIELLEAGISFKKGKSKSLFGFEFKGGVLKMPYFKIDYRKETLFRNLIAFEQCCHQSNSYITDYVNFLACLIKSTEDVWLLARKGIIEHRLGSHAEAANLIQNMCKETLVLGGKFYFAGLCEKLIVYCRTPNCFTTMRTIKSYCSCAVDLQISIG